MYISRTLNPSGLAYLLLYAGRQARIFFRLNILKILEHMAELAQPQSAGERLATRIFNLTRQEFGVTFFFEFTTFPRSNSHQDAFSFSE